MEPKFNHFDAEGNAVMVDVSSKAPTHREAVARGTIKVSRPVLDAITCHTSAKGDVLGVARVAGIMATKRTSELIPLCHPLMLSHCSVEFTLLPAECAVQAQCTVKLDGKTGVEMEALTGVNVALLTIYDMCKAIDKGMEITGVHLVHKEGGKSGSFDNPNPHTPAVVAVSGVKNSGKTTLIAAMLPHLIAAGRTIAVVKHDGHSFLADPEGTDTGKHMDAGACGTAIFDSDKYKVVRRVPVTEEELIPMFPEADLILLEGFKHTKWPKLEVVRAGNSDDFVCDPNTILALVTDLPRLLEVTLPLILPNVPRIALGDAAAAANAVLAYLDGRMP